MKNLNKKQLEFLRYLDNYATRYSPPTCEILATSLVVSNESVRGRMRFFQANGLVTNSTNNTWVLTDLGKQALNGYARDPKKLSEAIKRLASSWPFHMHEILLDNGYGGDIHNKYNRPVASFRNVERARAFMTVVEELVKQNSNP